MRSLMAVATILSTFAASATIDCVNAQVAPSRMITLVVPFPAGGPTDTIGRIVAEGLQSVLGQPVIVENNPGATGSIGTGRVARSDADGRTLILGTVATHVFNGAAYDLKYDVVKDFEPISLVAFDPQIIVVKKAMPADDPGSLSDDDYFAILAFDLKANGIDVSGKKIDAVTTEQIVLH